MANNCHLENAPCYLAAVVLDEDGFIVDGAPVYATEGIITFRPEVESENGTDLTRTGWTANTLAGHRAEKWWNLTGEIATKDWALFEALTAQPAVRNVADDVVGFHRPLQHGGVGNTKPRAAIVIVTGSTPDESYGCATPASGQTPCVGQFWPLTTDWNVDLPEKSATAPTIPFTAKAFGALHPTGGVLNLWPATANPPGIPRGMAVSEAFVDCSALPTLDGNTIVTPPLPEPSGPVTRILGDSNTQSGSSWAYQLACTPTKWAWGGLGVWAKAIYAADQSLDLNMAEIVGPTPGRRIVVMLGTNDVTPTAGFQGMTTAPQITYALNRMAHRMVRDHAAQSVRWMTIPPVRATSSPERIARTELWNQAILATPYAVDARGAFPAALPDGDSSDDVHLNASGHTKLANYVSPLICTYP